MNKNGWFKYDIHGFAQHEFVTADQMILPRDGNGIIMKRCRVFRRLKQIGRRNPGISHWIINIYTKVDIGISEFLVRDFLVSFSFLEVIHSFYSGPDRDERQSPSA